MNGYGKKVLDKVLPFDIRKRLSIQKIHMENTDKSQWYQFPYFHSRKFGKRGSKKYCIFRFAMPNQMLFSAARQYIFMYEWAVAKGFIPIVDMEWSYYYKDYCLGCDNMWDKFFVQPMSVKEALGQDYVLVEEVGAYKIWMETTCQEINGNKTDHWLHIRQDGWHQYYSKVNEYVQKCWVFRPDVLERFRKRYGFRIQAAQKPLGVFLYESFSVDLDKKRTREDETKNMFRQHPLTPGIKEVVEIVQSHVEKWGCDKIFLSAMQQESLELFQERFGDRLIYVERKRNTIEETLEKEEYWNLKGEEWDNYFKNQEVQEVKYGQMSAYADEIIGLSQCRYFIGAKASGAIAALALNGGRYEDIYILPDRNHIDRY